MKTFKWTVPQPQHHDPRLMHRNEFDHWARVRLRGPEWFIVQKGLFLSALVPLLSSWIDGSAFSVELAMVCWMLGICLGSALWLRRELLFARSREQGMRTPGDDLLD